MFLSLAVPRVRVMIGRRHVASERGPVPRILLALATAHGVTNVSVYDPTPDATTQLSRYAAGPTR